MNENEFCKYLNDAISNHFREENEGNDSDVYVEKVIDEGVIGLNWRTRLDECITMANIESIAIFILDEFLEVEQVLTPFGPYKRINYS